MIKNIDSYEEFCQKLNSSQKDKLLLLIYIRNWIINIINKIDKDNIDYNLDRLLLENDDLYFKPELKQSFKNELKNDILSNIVDKSFDAFKYISNNMRENIIRENIVMPVYKVKEINSSCLNWLSRKPGNSIKEKISNNNHSMLAVRRRMTLNTGENRLFIAFLKNISRLLQLKLDSISDFVKSESYGNFVAKTKITINSELSNERNFLEQCLYFLNTPDIEEIGLWNNMPPNNALLGDKNYKKIWNAWGVLKNIDEWIKDDCSKIAHNFCELSFIELLTIISRYFYLPQVPFTVDYKEFEFSIKSPFLYAVDSNGNKFEISKQHIKEESKSIINIFYRGASLIVEFYNDRILFQNNNRKICEYGLNIQNLNRINYVFSLMMSKFKLYQNNIWKKYYENKYSEQEKNIYNEVVMNIYSVYPRYIANNGRVSKLDSRIIQQKYVCDDKEYIIPVDISRAIEIHKSIETYSFLNSIRSNSIFQMTNLFHLLESHIKSKKFAFIYPDIFSELQVSLLYKSARGAFNNVTAFPNSIAFAFYYLKKYQVDSIIPNNKSNGNFILIADLVNDKLVLSLIHGIVDETGKLKNDIPEYKGLVFERHPSISFSLKDDIDILKENLKSDEIYDIWGIDGIKDERDNLSVLFDENNQFRINSNLCNTINNYNIDITDYINEFLQKYEKIIGKSKVISYISDSEHIVSYDYNLEYIDKSSSLEGYTFFKQLQKKTKISLWKDHLQKLSIKLLYGEFPLVDDETITPQFDIEHKIPINKTFTLPKGVKEYKFGLILNDSSENSRFMAVIKNPAFPLSENIECTLDMTYKYGADDPYELFFIPKDTAKAKFDKAKVIWMPQDEYLYKDLNSPVFPNVPSYDELQHFQSKNGEENLISGPKGIINKFQEIIDSRQYETLRPSDYNVKLNGKYGDRVFYINNFKGGNITLKFRESSIIYIERKNNVSFDNIIDNKKMISFDIPKDFTTKNVVRYRCSLKSSWKYISNKGYACFEDNVNIDGEYKNITFYQDNFIDKKTCNKDITHVSFELKKEPIKDKYGNYRYIAKWINDEDNKKYEPEKIYNVENIRLGKKINTNIFYGRILFLVHKIFSENKSKYDRDCPRELVNSITNFSHAFKEIYYDVGNGLKPVVFNIMSLMAKNIDDYYDIAFEHMQKYFDGSIKLPDNIGYALGSCNNDKEIQLKNILFDFPEEKKDKVVCILSKAIWGNRHFVFSDNVERDKLLYYLYVAIDYIVDMIDGKILNKNRDIGKCIEYILGVFRLRELGDSQLNYKLSLNNPKIQTLYFYIEKIIEKVKNNEFGIKSFLKLEISDKGQYKDIPDLLYAMLVYITGDTGSSNIKINIDETDDEDEENDED